MSRFNFTQSLKLLGIPSSFETSVDRWWAVVKKGNPFYINWGKTLPSWWFQPVWKVLVKIGSFPIWNHHLVTNNIVAWYEPDYINRSYVLSKYSSLHICWRGTHHWNSTWKLKIPRKFQESDTWILLVSYEKHLNNSTISTGLKVSTLLSPTGLQTL